MRFIKIENDREIPYVQPLHIADRLVFTSAPKILAQHGYLPLVEADYPVYRPGYRVERKVVLDESGECYNEVYEYTPIGEDDELTAEEAEIIMGGGEI